MKALSHTESVIETRTGIVDIAFSLEAPLELKSLLLSNKHDKDLASQHAYLGVSEVA